MALEKTFNRLTLLQKQLALVGAVLFWQLLLIGTLQFLLTQAENETRRSQRAYDVSAEVNQTVKSLTDAALALVAFGVSHNNDFGSRFETLYADAGAEMSVLEQDCSEFPDDKTQIEAVLVSATNTRDLMLECNRKIKQFGHTHTLGLKSLSQAIKPRFQDLSARVVDFDEHHKNIEGTERKKMERSKFLLRCMLVALSIMEIAIAWASVFYFSRSITGRLEIVSDNAVRLAAGQPLQPRLGGGDEIVHLDKVFHNMARALVDAADKERAIIDGMPAGFIALNRFGLIEAVNPRTLQMFNAATAEQLLEKPLTDIIVSPTKSALSFDQVKQASLERMTNFQFRRIDGTVFPAELSINAIRNSKEEVLICNILDVSERYEIERMKQEFVAIVSHDLKTPLTSLQGSLHLLNLGTLGELNDRGKQMIDGMQQETKRLVRLVSDLLDIARMEAGHIDLDCRSIEFASLLSDCLNSVKSAAQQKSITLTVNCPPLQISADSDRLMQVVVNLLTNAIKFAPPNSEVIVSCEVSDQAIEVTVTDSGPGIPEDSQSRIFERFQQVAGENYTNKQGTGLGLAICKLLVEAHGGTIGVRSIPDNGATFWFKIPRQSISANKIADKQPVTKTFAPDLVEQSTDKQ